MQGGKVHRREQVNWRPVHGRAVKVLLARAARAGKGQSELAVKGYDPPRGGIPCTQHIGPHGQHHQPEAGAGDAGAGTVVEKYLFFIVFFVFCPSSYAR